MFALLILSLAAPATLDDAALRRAVAAPFDKAAEMNRREVLGSWRGVPVVAEHPCSDVCPAYTVRIVHLDLDPGAACLRAGGRNVSRTVPMGIAAMPKLFCVPAPIAER